MTQLEELYRSSRLPHVKMMSRILGGDWATAEDVVQEAYTRALAFSTSYDPKLGAMKPWLNKIMFNALRDIQREYQNRPTAEIEGLSEEDVLHLTVDVELILPLIEGVENLAHQRVLYLFYVLGYNSREISQIEEGITQTNVTSILSRFKERVSK